MVNKLFYSFLLFFLILTLNSVNHTIQLNHSTLDNKNLEGINNKSSLRLTNQVKTEKTSPFFLVDNLMVVRYSPVVLLPSFEWYAEKGLIFNASEYIPTILVNNTNILSPANITHDQLRKFGHSWDVTEFDGTNAPVNLEYRLLNSLGEIITSSSINIYVDIPKIEEFDYLRSEIHFGKTKNPYYYSGLQQGDFKIIFNPDGFIVKFIPNAKGKLDNYHTWLNKSDYNSVMDLLLTKKFFLFKKTYFDQFTYNNETTYFISIKIWKNDGSHILETRAYRGNPIPSNLFQLWEKLDILINNKSINFELKSSNNLFFNEFEFFLFLLAIFAFLGKKVRR